MIERLLSVFVRKYSIELSIILLQLVSPLENGGAGYKIKLFDPILDLDGWEVDRSKKWIKIERNGKFRPHSDRDRARFLKSAIEFLKIGPTFLSRYVGGSLNATLGVLEVLVGAVGILVPEPGTTGAGIVIVTLGMNNIITGVSQVGGINQGNGVDILESMSGFMGQELARFTHYDSQVGRDLGKQLYIVSSIAAGSFASIKILRIPNKAFWMRGVGGQKGGFTLGRIDMMYPSRKAKDGMTIFSINNNKGKSILRFVTHNGVLNVNGRIYNMPHGRLLHHEKNPHKIILGILKLLHHGAKF